jgi:hypothetical protein
MGPSPILLHGPISASMAIPETKSKAPLPEISQTGMPPTSNFIDFRHAGGGVFADSMVDFSKNCHCAMGLLNSRSPGLRKKIPVQF